MAVPLPKPEPPTEPPIDIARRLAEEEEADKTVVKYALPAAPNPFNRAYPPRPPGSFWSQGYFCRRS